MPNPNRQKRLPRYRRSPKEVRNFNWTQRDTEILRALHRHELLRTTHIVQLLSDYSAQNTRRRLQLLFHHGYLGRRRDDCPGNTPDTYFRTDKGERFLAEHAFVAHPRLSWKKSKQSKKGFFDDHHLFISDIMIALECACRLHSNEVALIRSEEILFGIPIERHPHRQLQWSVTVSDGLWSSEETIIPDGVFGLHFLNRPQENDRAFFFLEADRATMTDGRFYDKMVAYHETWRQKIHKIDLGLSRFRMLTITTSPERVENFILKNKQLNGGEGSGLFLFTDIKSLAEHGDVLTLPLQGGHREETIRLLDH